MPIAIRDMHVNSKERAPHDRASEHDLPTRYGNASKRQQDAADRCRPPENNGDNWHGESPTT
jgi:hypothetical protein